MTGFDAELYLRLCAEEILVGGEDRDHDDDPLLQRAQALMAAGAISASVVERVFHEYQDAADLRGLHWSRPYGSSREPATDITAVRPRIADCHQTLELSWGTVVLRYALFTAGGLRISAIVRFPVTPAPQRRRRGMRYGPRHSPQNLTVNDDAGASASAHFSGGGGDSEWTGHFEVGDNLSSTTRWLDIDGTRVELIGHEADPDRRVAIESLDTADPVRHHLQRCLERLTRPEMSGSLDLVAGTLVDAGAIAADAPYLLEAYEIVQALQGFHHGRPFRHGRATKRGRATTQAALPEPWRSIVSRLGQVGGPTGSVFVGAVTPPFDGICVSVASLESHDEDFEIDIGVESVSSTIRGYGDLQGWVTYLAADDRGNHYLGNLNGWGGSDTGLQGTVRFEPALDPEATRLDLFITADTERAVIGVDLRWDGAP